MLYDAFLKQYGDQMTEEHLEHLNILCVRLVFCFYAEDAGLFGKRNMFHDYMAQYEENPNSFKDHLIQFFRVLDQKPEDRDPYLSGELLAFPYVNGGLFENEKLLFQD